MSLHITAVEKEMAPTAWASFRSTPRGEQLAFEGFMQPALELPPFLPSAPRKRARAALAEAAAQLARMERQ